MMIKGATVHGFRSSFRDWADTVSNFPREITETAWAHVVGDEAEQDRRSDAPEKRRKLKEAREAYCKPDSHRTTFIYGTLDELLLARLASCRRS
jgi:hypothetical protein